MNKKPLAQKLLGRKSEHPLETMIPLSEEWFHSSVGQSMLSEQQGLVDDALSQLFGYHLLQLSTCRDLCLHDSSRVGHRFAMSPLAGNGISCLTEEDSLPLESESIDVALLHHVLEYAQHPLELLKEVSRVVLPSGKVVIVGFNPYSPMGVMSLSGQMRGKGVWQNHIVGVTRLADWLTLMDFRVESVQYGFYRPPFSVSFAEGVVNRLEQKMKHTQLPLGCFYVLVAQKEVSRLTPIKQKWRRSPKSMIPLVEPSLYTSKPKNKTTIH